MRAAKVRASLMFGAKLMVSAGGVWFVLHEYDLFGILPRMLERGQGWLALALGIVIAQIAVAAIRWHSILRSLRLLMPLSAVVQIFYAMAFLNSFLPAGLAGDTLRVWLLRRNPHGIATAVNSVLIDRLVVVLALLLAAVAVQPFLWLQAATPILTLAIVGSALSLIAAIGGVMFVVPRIHCPIHWPIFGRLLPMLHAVSRDLRQVFLGIAGLSRAIVAAFASNLLLVSALPISVGGWGTREIAMIYMLGLFAVPPDLAAAVSIQFGLCLTVASLVGAPVWAMLGQNRARPVSGGMRPGGIS